MAGVGEDAFDVESCRSGGARHGDRGLWVADARPVEPGVDLDEHPQPLAHAFHGSSNPSDDAANFAAKVKGFVAAFRPNATGLQNALAATLLPDVLQVNTDQPQNTAGYLSYVLAANGKGYGGRKLTDDVVDISLTAVFSDLLDPTQFVCKPFTLPL